MRAHYLYLKGDNVAVAQCPASCGELIQGWILGSEKLVSCPVDWYSTVAVTAAPPLVNERPLSRAMVERVLAHWQYPAHWSNEIRVDVRSSIPVAKGMASSTADIAATAVATAHHLGHSLDETTLAQLFWGGNHFCTDRRRYEFIVKSTTTRPVGDLRILHCAEKNDLKMIFLH